MNFQDVEQLVAAGESETVEFKKFTAQLRRAGETLCAFLNGHDGRIFIGVTAEVRSHTSTTVTGLSDQSFGSSRHSERLVSRHSRFWRQFAVGLLEILAGAIPGIRNPKAHDNLTITKERAIHHLFLASLLFNRLDERTT